MTANDLSKALSAPGFERVTMNGLVVYTVPAFASRGVRYGFTTRIGGVSSGRFESLNLSLKPEDNPFPVRKNLSLLCEVFDVDDSETVVCNYRHGNNVEPVDASHRGMGYYRENTLPGCDGIMTGVSGLPLITLHADCVPIALFDPVSRAGCLCHAGWRGVISGIPENAVNKMTALYKASPKNLIAAIGPCIMPCCFEVDLPVAEMFMGDYQALGIIERRGEKYHIDLVKCIASRLFDLGVTPENLTTALLCTSCGADEFYSFRRDSAPTGAMAQLMVF